MNAARNDTNTKLKIIFINGTVLDVERRDILRWFIEPANLKFLAATSAIFLIYFGYVGRQDYLPEEIWQLGLTVLVLVLFFFVVVLLTVFLGFYIARIHPGFMLPMTVVIVVAHVLNQILGGSFVEIWGVHVPGSAILYLRVIKIYFIVLALEIIYSAYILPRSQLYQNRLLLNLSVLSPSLPKETEPQESVAPEADKEAPTNVASDAAIGTPIPVDEPLYLGGSRFDRQQIRMIRAEQNYINIELDTETVLVRAKMKEAAEQLCSSLGIQVHRSYWVSYGRIARTKNLSNGKLELELTNGEILFVPRARRKDVKEAIEKNRDGSHKRLAQPR